VLEKIINAKNNLIEPLILFIVFIS